MRELASYSSTELLVSSTACKGVAQQCLDSHLLPPGLAFCLHHQGLLQMLAGNLSDIHTACGAAPHTCPFAAHCRHCGVLCAVYLPA